MVDCVTSRVQRFTLRSPAETAKESSSVSAPVLILLVEDNPADVGLVRKALEEHRVEGDLVVVADGETAIQLIEDLEAQLMECPNLAIVDLNLPRKSGRAVLERMRRTEICSAIPVVILSSSDAQQDRSDAERLGANRYVRKPSTLDEFLNLGAIFKATLSQSSQ